MARWTHSADNGKQTSLQTSYDSYRRTEFGVPEKVQNFDLDFQQHLRLGSRQDIVWGLGYRDSSSGFSSGYAFSLAPSFRTANLYTAFLQDEIRMTNSLSLTLGDRLEHNPYTGWEDEPSGRVAWTPGSGRNTLWMSAAKAYRQPSRSDVGIQVDLQSLVIAPNTVQVLRLFGNPHIDDEEVRDYEAGYRTRIGNALTVDMAAFASFYKHLETYEPGLPNVIPGSPVQIVVPMVFSNLARAVDYGGELSLNWNPAPRWRIRPSYSYLHATLWSEPSSHGSIDGNISTDFPQNQFQIRSMINLARNTELDQAVYYTARLPGGTIPGHARLDVRLAHRLGESIEVSVVGQNLLRPRTTEYGDAYSTIGTQELRSVYGRIAWTF